MITFFVLNVMGLTLSAYVMLGYFVEQRERAHRALEAEQERSERLLLNVLPGRSPSAEGRDRGDRGSLRRGERALRGPRRLHGAVVGHGRRRAVALLDRIFSAFDRLADAEGVEKIRTIGDAYMVARGLPEPRPDHSKRSPAWRLRRGTRSRRSASGPDRAGSRSGSGSTRDRWWQA